MSTPFVISEHVGSVLPLLTFTEEVDTARVSAYLRAGHSLDYGSDFTDRVHCKYKNSKEHVRGLYDCIKNGKLLTKLKRPARKQVDDARVYHTGFHSLSQLSKEVRGYLCHDKYDDIDISNCHPTLLYAEAKKAKLHLPALERLVTDRATVFEEVKAATGCTDAQAKLLAIIKLYGGGLTKWREQCAVPEFDTSTLPWYTMFERDLTLVTEEVEKNNPELWKKTRAKVLRENKARQQKGEAGKKQVGPTMLSNYAQCIERRVIDCVYNQLPEDVREHAVYCYDGIMFPKRIKMTPERIAQYTHADYPMVKWAAKQFEGWEEVDKFVKENSEAPPPEDDEEPLPQTPLQKLKLDIHYLNSLSLYRYQKQYFEQFCIKIRTGDFWICQQMFDPHANRGEGATYRKQYTMDIKRLQHAYGEVQTGKVLDIETGKYIKLPKNSPHSVFLTRWFSDINKRASTDITFQPLACPYEDIVQGSEMYNTFLGYPKHLFDVNNTPTQSSHKLLALWKQMVHDLVRGDGTTGVLSAEEEEDTYAGVMSFFACTVMDPARRLEHALIFEGAQGCCKGTIIDTIGALVGSEHYISTSKVDDLLGTHSEGFLNRVLVNLDESDSADMKGKQGLLKHIVTMKEQHINPKHMRPFKIDVHANLILTSNKKNMICIDATSGERRFIIVNATNKWCTGYGTEFWTKVHTGFGTPEFQKLLFEYLGEYYDTTARTFDFKSFKYRNSRRGPYRQLMVNYTPDLALYFQDILESRKFKYVGRRVTSTGEETASIKGVDHGALIPSDFNPTDPVQKFWEQDEWGEPMLFCGDSMVKSVRTWASMNHFKYSETMNNQVFYRKISELNFPMKKVVKSNRTYISMIPKDLYDALAQKNYLIIDPDSEKEKQVTKYEYTSDIVDIINMEF